MRVFNVDMSRLICIKIDFGEDLFDTIQGEITRQNIKHGVILNGIGSISSFHLHVIKTTQLPPGRNFYKDEGPYDVDNINGYIVDGNLHAHIVVSNENETFGGHLEKGTIAHTFCIVTVADTSESALTGIDYYAGKIMPASL